MYMDQKMHESAKLCLLLKQKNKIFLDCENVLDPGYLNSFKRKRRKK